MKEQDGNNGRVYPTCYVCGYPNCADSVLFVRQVTPGTAHFPFLLNHEPPENSQPIVNDKVLACELCANLLKLQWKKHECLNMPIVKRIYWLKRDDMLPYSGVEVGMQTEYASQFLGLAPDPMPVDERVTFSSRSTRAASTTLSDSSKHITHSIPSVNNPVMVHQPMRVPSSVQVTKLSPNVKKTDAIQEPSHSSATVSTTTTEPHINISSSSNNNNNSDNEDFTPEPQQEEALDLSVDRKRADKRSRISDVNSPLEVLDLSMPDKNAITEVCYVCGDHYSRGTLLEMYAKEQAPNRPFFPSLLHHSRPSKSHPMEASGCVQGCKSCYQFLCNQWMFFNSHEIDHKSRDYLLLKLPVRIENNYTILCFECHDLVQFGMAKVIYTSNLENKSYLPDVEKRLSFTDYQPSSQAAKIICLDCSLKKHVETSSDASNETIDICETSSPEAKRKKYIGTSLLSLNDRASVVSPGEILSSIARACSSAGLVGLRSNTMLDDCSVACYLCHQAHGKTSMCWISVHRESSPDGMYFPFIKNISRISTALVSEDGKVLMCSPCYLHLKRQWEEFELKNIAVEQRIFSCRASSVDSSSPIRTPSMSPTYMASDSQQTVVEFLAQKHGDTEKLAEYSQNISIKELEMDMSNLRNSSNSLPSITYQNPLKIPIKCFLCGFLSKSGETYAVCSKGSQGQSDMVFPFLEAHASPNQQASIGNNNYLICTFCFHTLALQWDRFEKSHVEPFGRFYDTYNFICYICSQKTYRKRLRQLQVENYPFLRDHVRPPSALVVAEGHAVTVCKDCYSRLRDQYNDMEKCGVPVDRREYNWIKKPAPPQYQLQQSAVAAPVQGAAVAAASSAAGAASRYAMMGIPSPSSRSRPSTSSTFSPEGTLPRDTPTTTAGGAELAPTASTSSSTGATLLYSAVMPGTSHQSTAAPVMKKTGL